MTFLGFKYVGGRNKNAGYIRVRNAAAALIRAKQMPNTNNAAKSAKAAAVEKAKTNLTGAINTYITSGTPAPGGAGGPPPPGGPPPANKNANINMRPLNRRGVQGVLRRPLPQPNSDTAPVKVPGQAIIQLLSNNTAAINADVYKYRGFFYGMIKDRPNGNRRANTFYKVRPVRDNPPTFKFIPTNAQEFKLNKNAATNAVTGISPKTNSPFSGGNALANFNQWWETVKSQSAANQSTQFMQFMQPKSIPVKRNGETPENFAKRQAATKANSNRYIRITSITPKSDPQARTRQQFWKLVVEQIQKLPKNKFKSVPWSNFFDKLPNGGFDEAFGGSNTNRRLKHGQFTAWYRGLPQNMTPEVRANFFNRIRQLPPKGARNNATYAANAAVAAIFPRLPSNKNNVAHARRIANYYKTKNMTNLRETNNINLNNSVNKANSRQRAQFWAAVTR